MSEPTNPKTIRRQDLWRLQYRQNRYLADISYELLCQRATDVMLNVVTLTREGEIGIEGRQRDGTYWFELFGHVLEEFGIRGMGLPHGFLSEAPMPRPTSPRPPRAVSALSQLSYDPSGKMIKYGDIQWLKLSISHGIFRISPASAYSGSSMNVARKDAELERQAFIPIIQHFDVPRRIGTVHETVRTGSDYYLACFARTYSYRLCDDFAANGCLVVRDSELFTERMFNAAREKLAEFKGVFKDVRYYDPFNLPEQRLDPFSSKDLRYAYQQECRFIWLPFTARSHLAVIELVLGNLSDCCDLVQFE